MVRPKVILDLEYEVQSMLHVCSVDSDELVTMTVDIIRHSKE